MFDYLHSTKGFIVFNAVGLALIFALAAIGLAL